MGRGGVVRSIAVGRVWGRGGGKLGRAPLGGAPKIREDSRAKRWLNHLRSRIDEWKIEGERKVKIHASHHARHRPGRLER